MDEISYLQYMTETEDWLKIGRARLLGDLIERHSTQLPERELLEVGAGAGQNLPTLARFGVVDAIEVNARGRAAITAKNVTRDVFADAIPFALDRQYDVICALDVIEHISDDRGALHWIATRLRPGGLLILTVPAYSWLFSPHDRILGHFRRYSRPQLLASLPPQMDTLTAAYFTHFAFPFAVVARAAWSLRRSVRDLPPSKHSSPKGHLANRVLGGLFSFERTLIRRGYQPSFGLSVYAVAKKKGSDRP